MLLLLSQLPGAEPCRQGRLRHESQEVHPWRRKEATTAELGALLFQPCGDASTGRLKQKCAWWQTGSVVQISVLGWWETLREERVGFQSPLGSPSPIPELCVVGKTEMGSTEDIIQCVCGDCRWQACVKQMCYRGFSAVRARTDSLFFLSSHVSRSVSPTTTSQIQARKKRRGVSVICKEPLALLKRLSPAFCSAALSTERSQEDPSGALSSLD